MRQSKLRWKDNERSAQASFSIPYVGELRIEVEAELPGGRQAHTAEERRALALRNAQLLVRNLANELDRRVY